MTTFQVASSSAAAAVSLWNGSTNDAPPSGWDALTFADDAWSSATSAAHSTGYPTIAGVEAIWSSDVPLSGTEICLVRHRFTLPVSSVRSASLQIEADDYLLSASINGNALAVSGAADTSQTIDIDPGFLRSGLDNVLAVSVQNGAFGAGNASVDYLLSVTYGGDGEGSSEPAYSSSYDWLRLAHASGKGHIEINGLMMRVHLNNIDVLHMPLPVLSSTPNTIVGQDDATGLLAFCPEVHLPRARADTLLPPPTPTTTPDLCTPLRCGVSNACTTHLLSLYANWARWLSPLFALLGTVAVATFIEEILPMLLAEEAAASTLAIWGEFKVQIQAILGVLTGNLLPSPTPDATVDIQKMLFCQLQCEAGSVQPNAAQIRGWHDALVSYPSWAISSLQGQLLELLTKYTPLEDWLTAASSATTSSACATWTCS